ncbi:tyrosine-protein phosphatase [Methyloraptor flagellatus]|uniref:Tyrosine-protein phosphatase n=1 Tax=Methyloraptor flagellatus TaxID=3162530 RepID=A0AAU7XJJ8_9HYPH
MRPPMSHDLRHSVWRGLKVGGLSILLVAFGIGGWAGYLRLTGNIHEVETGRVFRSGQLWPSQFASMIRAHDIRTVINLRGESPGESWFDQELQTAAARGVKYISVPMSANAEPSPELLMKLVHALDTAEQPVLIHCEGGADRTGLASAIYRYRRLGDPPEQASGQLSYWYGHFPWLFSRTGAMDRTFWRLVGQSEATGTTRQRVSAQQKPEPKMNVRED